MGDRERSVPLLGAAGSGSLTQLVRTVGLQRAATRTECVLIDSLRPIAQSAPQRCVVDVEAQVRRRELTAPARTPCRFVTYVSNTNLASTLAFTLLKGVL